MANDATRARARRKLEKDGGKVLNAVTVADYAGWIECLREEQYFHEGQEVTPEQVRSATEYWIKDHCRRYRRQQADKLIHSRTGLLERTQPLPNEINLPPEEPHMFSTRFSKGGHWSFRPGEKKDKGRSLTPEEIAEICEDRPDLEPTAAGVIQDLGMRIVGD